MAVDLIKILLLCTDFTTTETITVTLNKVLSLETPFTLL